MSAFHHVALRVKDCEVAARFYAQAFGLVEARRIEDEAGLRAIWLRAGTGVLMLERALRGAGEAAGSGHVLVFSTDDLQRAQARLDTAGIAVVDRTASTLYVSDPDGHRAGVSVHRFDPPSA